MSGNGNSSALPLVTDDDELDRVILRYLSNVDQRTKLDYLRDCLDYLRDCSDDDLRPALLGFGTHMLMQVIAETASLNQDLRSEPATLRRLLSDNDSLMEAVINVIRQPSHPFHTLRYHSANTILLTYDYCSDFSCWQRHCFPCHPKQSPTTKQTVRISSPCSLQRLTSPHPQSKVKTIWIDLLTLRTDCACQRSYP